MQVLGKLLCVDCGSNTNLFKVDHPTRRTYGNLCGDCIEKYERIEETVREEFANDVEWERTHCDPESYADQVLAECDPNNEIDYYESHKEL